MWHIKHICLCGFANRFDISVGQNDKQNKIQKAIDINKIKCDAAILTRFFIKHQTSTEHTEYLDRFAWVLFVILPLLLLLRRLLLPLWFFCICCWYYFIFLFCLLLTLINCCARLLGELGRLSALILLSNINHTHIHGRIHT